MAAAFLTNFMFWSGLSLGGIVLAALVDVTGGQWLGPMRVTAEGFRIFLPVSLGLFLVLIWRSRDFYPWARTGVDSRWFAPAFVYVRDALVLVAVYVSAFVYCRASRRRRNDPAAAAPARAGAILLGVYVVGFSIVSVDLVMSLEPRWTSTLFPAFVVSGNVFAGAAAVGASWAWTAPDALTSVGASRARDMANLLVGLALFWTYLFWSQFLVIWYGNVTAEVGYVMARIGVSRAPGWIVLGMCCGLPSIVFVPQWGKTRVAMKLVLPFVLVGLWLAQWLLVAPALVRDPAGRTFIAALFVTLLFAIVFVASVSLARQDPTA
jgi:hypothetical protein